MDEILRTPSCHSVNGCRNGSNPEMGSPFHSPNNASCCFIKVALFFPLQQTHLLVLDRLADLQCVEHNYLCIADCAHSLHRLCLINFGASQLFSLGSLSLVLWLRVWAKKRLVMQYNGPKFLIRPAPGSPGARQYAFVGRLQGRPQSARKTCYSITTRDRAGNT